MAIVFTGSKTVTVGVTPKLTAPALTTLMATAPELWTVQQLKDLDRALDHIPYGGDTSRVIGDLLP